MVDPRVHRKMEGLIAHCEKNGMGILLTNGRHSIDYLLDYPVTDGLEKALRDKLNERGGRTIFHNEYEELLRQFQARYIELIALVVKNNWEFYPFPFKLTPKNTCLVFRKKSSVSYLQEAISGAA